jgi:hypothetical protein
MKSNSTQMPKPAMEKPAYKRTAVVGSMSKGGITYKTSSGTKAYSVPMKKMGK